MLGPTMTTYSLDDINNMTRASFIDTLGGIFEHSPWVAEGAFEKRPLPSLAELHEVMVAVVENADEEAQLELILAHPDLAGKAAVAGDLTEHSRQEQAGAGLDTLTAEEYARFHSLNNAYKEKFGFPFILAVKGHDKHSILTAFETRLQHDRVTEMHTALEQIYQIAWFRLAGLVPT